MGALVNRLARWLDPIRDLSWTLGPTRFSVIVVLVIGLGLAGTDQMQDVLRALTEDANPIGIAGFYVALSWWTARASSWIASCGRCRGAPTPPPARRASHATSHTCRERWASRLSPPWRSLWLAHRLGPCRRRRS
jgi:hypothetical protein